MADKTLTSANSVYTIIVPSLFPAPQQLKGYAADKAFSTEMIDLAEVVMGVDGIMSAGYTPNPTKQTVTLQADSPSMDVFTAILEATKTAREIFWINGTIAIPGTGENYTMTRGILTSAMSLPDAQKILQPRNFVITWESVRRTLL